ncbi:MAG: 2-C-methyl-D-erythritol 4-phosphate cytidylyltransferase, partial [SAR202 cluster bacterium]|nr:2-C-methyl-D-erythritol 4-phosphate cytidylyltransferase [SAR202 cluster bacterium]
QDSVRNGLAAVTESDWVVIHDGARPCVDTATLERGLAAARETGAAIAAVPVKDTIKVVDSRNTVVTTPSRDTLWAVQTPQVFRTRLLIEAHDAVRDDVTDDASMVERNGGVVKVFMGSYDNIKVTTPEDLAIAEAFLSRKTRPVAGRAR